MGDMDIGSMFVKLGLELDEFRRQINSVEDELDKRAASFAKLGVGLTAAITAPLAALAAEGLTTLAGFQSEMNKVSALGDIFGKDLEKLNKQAMDLGEKTVFSAKQAAEAMGELAAAGFKTEQIYSSMPGVLSLAAVEGMKMADAAKIAGAAINMFGFQAGDMGKVADILAKTSQESATSVGKLGYSLQYVGSIARNTGQDFVAINAALGVLANAGRTGTSAGTALRAMLMGLDAPTNKAAAALERLNISVKDSNGKLLPMNELIKKLQPLMNDSAAATTIFGKRWSDISILLQNGGKNFDDMASKIQNFAGAAKKSADIMRQGLGGAWEELTSQLEGFKIKVGQILEPLAMGFVKLAQDIVKSLSVAADMFRSLPTSMQLSVLGFTALAAAAGPLLLAMAGIITALTTTAAAWPAVIGLFEAGGVAAVGFSAGVAAIAVAITAVDFLKVGAELGALIEDIKVATGLMFSWKDAFDVLTGAGNGFYSLLKKLPAGFSPVVDILALAEGRFAAFGKGIVDFAVGMESAASKALRPLAILKDVIQKLDEALTLFTGKHAAMFEAANANLARSNKAVADSMKSQYDNAMAAIAAQKAAAASAQIMADVQEKVTANSKKAKKAQDEELVAIKSAIKEKETLAKVDKSIIDFNIQSHTALKAAVHSALSQAILDWNAFHKALGQDEAIKALAGIGKAIEDNMMKPLRDAIKNQKDIDEMWKATKFRIDEVLKPLNDTIKKTAELDNAYKTLGITGVNSLEGIRDKAQAAYDVIQKMYDQGDQQVSYTNLLEAQEKLLDSEKKLAQSRGENWQQYDEQMKSVGATLDEMAGKPTKLAEEFNKFGKEIGAAFGTLTDNLVDAIIKGEGFGEAFKTLFDDLGKAVTNFAKNFLKTVLQEAIQGNIKSFNDLGKAAKKSLFDVQEMFDGSSATNKASGSGGIGSSAESSSKAVQGLTGWITAISSAVSAVANVLQYLQGRRMEQDIGRIEVTTRSILNEVSNLRADEWKREKHLYALDSLAEQMTRYGDSHGAFLSDILGTLQLMYDVLKNGISLNGDGGDANVVMIDFGKEAESAVDHLDRMNEQLKTAQYYLDEWDKQVEVSGDTFGAVTNSSIDMRDAFDDVVEAADKTNEGLKAGTKAYDEWKAKLTKDMDYERWLKDKLDAEKRANRATDRFGNIIDEAGNIVLYSTAYMQGMQDSWKASSMDLNAAMGQMTDTLILGADITAEAMKKAAKAAQDTADAVSAAGGSLSGAIERTSAQLGSSAATAGAIPAPSSSAGSARSGLIWYNGQWVDPKTYSPVPGSSAGMNLTVTVNNADAKTVANTMMTTWRNGGVDI